MVQKTFENEVVWVPELTRGLPADILDGYSFRDCRLVGPAVLLLWEGGKISKCHFQHPDSVFTLPESQGYFGMIGVQNTELIGVTFERIGIAGSQEIINRILSSFS